MTTRAEMEAIVDTREWGNSASAGDLVAGRECAYGSAVVNHKRIAALWSAYLGVEIGPEQVAMCMVLLKCSRLRATPGHEDSIADIEGYLHIYQQIIYTMETKT